MILGIETSTVACSVALFDGKVLAEYTLYLQQAHSARLMSLVDAVMRDSGAAGRKVSAVAVSVGPGSFTGVRIGVSTAKGLAFGWGAPVVPVPTLDALALASLPWDGPICTLLVARKNEVYAALFDGRDGAVLRPPGCYPGDSLAPLFENTKGTVLVVGDAAESYRGTLSSLLKGDVYIAPRWRMLPRASAVCELAVRLIESGIQVPPLELHPEYLRPSEAEVKWQSRQEGTSC